MFAQLDLFRARFLKISLKLPWLRALFLSRSNRILSLFSLTLLFYFSASVVFPIWVLLFAPIIWGVPHLMASLRYTSRSFNEQSKIHLLRFHFLMCAIVFAYRVAVDIYSMQILWSDHPLLLESCCIVASFFYQLYIYRTFSLRFLISFLFFSVLIALTYWFPVEVGLTAIFSHHYLPLYPWFKSCQTKKDRNVFFISALAYLGLSALILCGALNPVYDLVSSSGSIDFLNWDYVEIMRPFSNGQGSSQFWFNVVVLFAFSQSIHNFIWVKVIPENYQLQEYPPNFQWSFRKLNSDFGSVSLYMLIGVCLLSLLSWLVLEFQTARSLYFGLVSYHGFMEISALPFWKSNMKV